MSYQQLQVSKKKSLFVKVIVFEPSLNRFTVYLSLMLYLDQRQKQMREVFSQLNFRRCRSILDCLALFFTAFQLYVTVKCDIPANATANQSGTVLAQARKRSVALSLLEGVGPQPRPSTPSVPCRTSTASIRAKCSLPDLM